MLSQGKRKSGAENGSRPVKKSKVSLLRRCLSGPIVRTLTQLQGGSGGQWQTPAHASKLAASRGANLEVGDQGIWVTYARGMERKAEVEFAKLCDDVRLS